MSISFLLNGEAQSIAAPDPTQTLLDWLREERGLVGTKEGCNEGDCGACTVMVSDAETHRALNACILFMPQLNGKSVRTVEGVADAGLSSMQGAMVDLHGSQCGFCTPGFVMSMTTAHANGTTDYDRQLAGNLCRCTGYAPIIRAAKAGADGDLPDWIETDRAALAGVSGGETYLPKTSNELAAWYLENPKGTLIGGATDVALWVNKSLADISPVCFVSQIADMSQIEKSEDGLRIGASVSILDLRLAIADVYPHFAKMLERYGSEQVRGAATIGGNIANGSPIGDSPPALIALGAEVTLRRGDTRRTIPLADFFIAYGKQDRAASEFVESIFIPTQEDRLKCYKLSKRFDQDISAVCGCFNIHIVDGQVACCAIAFGGMAGTPHRAHKVETALLGQPWTRETVNAGMALFAQDYTPMDDMRASADYRIEGAKNLLLRYFLEDQGISTNVLEVSP